MRFFRRNSRRFANARKFRGFATRKRKASFSVEDKKLALLNYLKDEGIVDESLTVDDVKELYDDNKSFEVDGYEYIVGDYDEAHDWAVEDVKNTFDDLGIESFSESFQEQILNDDRFINQNMLRNIMNEDIDVYVDNMDDDEVYETITETYGVNEEDLKDMDEEDIRNELKYQVGGVYEDMPADYFRDMFGKKDFSEFLIDRGLLDVNAIAEEVVRVDGFANSLASYDGEEIDLGNGLYAYRWN